MNKYAHHLTQLDQEITTLLDLDTTLVRAVVPVVLENLMLMNRKQHDYGSLNLTKFGVPGIVVRTSDKLERLVQLTRPGAQAQVSEESIADTLRDLSNYGLIGYVMQKNLWPNENNRDR